MVVKIFSRWAAGLVRHKEEYVKSHPLLQKRCSEWADGTRLMITTGSKMQTKSSEYNIGWITTYVTLSHLRSKEFQSRIHKPCIPHHRDTSVYIEMHPRKVVALQKVKPLSSNLDVEASSLLILYRPQSKLIVGLSFILVAKLDCGIEYKHEAVI